jgi:hypothetical protein
MNVFVSKDYCASVGVISEDHLKIIDTFLYIFYLSSVPFTHKLASELSVFRKYILFFDME